MESQAQIKSFFSLLDLRFFHKPTIQRRGKKDFSRNNRMNKCNAWRKSDVIKWKQRNKMSGMIEFSCENVIRLPLLFQKLAKFASFMGKLRNLTSRHFPFAIRSPFEDLITHVPSWINRLWPMAQSSLILGQNFASGMLAEFLILCFDSEVNLCWNQLELIN